LRWAWCGFSARGLILPSVPSGAKLGGVWGKSPRGLCGGPAFLPRHVFFFQRTSSYLFKTGGKPITGILAGSEICQRFAQRGLTFGIFPGAPIFSPKARCVLPFFLSSGWGLRGFLFFQRNRTIVPQRPLRIPSLPLVSRLCLNIEFFFFVLFVKRAYRLRDSLSLLGFPSFFFSKTPCVNQGAQRLHRGDPQKIVSRIQLPHNLFFFFFLKRQDIRCIPFKSPFVHESRFFFWPSF